MKTAFLCAGAACALACSTSAAAHNSGADDHAPIGVMADHTHHKGEFMLSFRVMHMAMAGNQIGTDGVSDDTIATTISNRFAGMPMQPPTLRIVPQAMRSDMYMFGGMYAPSDAVTLMVMGSYVEKEMDLLTYQGGMGTTQLGTFRTNPKALGDTKVSALFPLVSRSVDDGARRDQVTLKAGFSLPTGSTTEAATVLTPMNTTSTMRAPYAMQAGTGTWDLEPALTYKGWRGRIGFGAQASAAIRLDRNKWGYAFGDVYQGTAWVSYRPARWVSVSGRVLGRSTGNVRGIDPAIMGPVQTANPDWQGGQRVDLIAGVNLLATRGALAGHRLGLELGAPIYQDLKGPQMAGDWHLTVGWQKAY
ncbi:alpha-amylase [Tsuneonella mangrovi]|uniref:alpha-amylase n=1 Tax=Tsuneonella mangrovi TaxID=1982042 RepID=UPI000BA2BA57|nr:alpha-amylase [Tsuneonella mangrovi]